MAEGDKKTPEGLPPGVGESTDAVGSGSQEISFLYFIFFGIRFCLPFNHEHRRNSIYYIGRVLKTFIKSFSF